MTRKEFEVWQLEHDLLEADLVRIEKTERRILRRLRCSPRPTADWPKSLSPRARATAEEARLTLVLIAQVRQHTGRLSGGSPRRAAHAALFAGLHASRAAVDAIKAEQAQAAAKARGVHQRTEAAKHDEKIRQYFETWRSSDELQLQHRHPVKYIRERLRGRSHITLPDWKIRRRLLEMGVRRTSRR